MGIFDALFHRPDINAYVAEYKETPGAYLIDVRTGPEYEAGWSYGAACGVNDISAIVKANFICNEQGMDPITLGFTDGADVAVRLVNASGVAINTAASDVPTTIFIPIPKEGEDWGALMNNGEAFGFTAALTGPVDMSGADTAAGQTFTVEYGTVTPTDSGPALNSQTFTATPADYAAVNCVKITANNLPANGSDPDIYSFVLNIGVKDADENDLTDIVRPIYYQNLRNTTGTYAGWYYGGYYALQTKIKADYIVRHFQEQPDGTFVEATADAQTLSALIGATDYSVSAKTYPYYTYDPARTTYSDSGTAAGAAKLAVPDDSSLEINLYYMLDTHSVRYAYDGTVPSGAPALPAAVTVRRGETVTVAPAPTLTGYAFSGWDQTGTLTVTQDVVIKGSWTPYAPAKSDPPVTKVIQGDTLTEEATFAFSMEAVSNDAGLATADMPMPQGAANGKLTVTHRQKSARESVEFGELTFTQVGVYEYVIYEEAGSAEFRGHIGQLERDSLLGADRLSELDAFLGIGESCFVGTLGDPESLRGNADAAAVQCGHCDLEALPEPAEEIFLRHPDMVEDEFRRSGRTDTHFVIMVAEGEAGHAFFKDEGTDAAGPRFRISYGKDNVDIGFSAVCDEDLVAVQDPVLAVKYGCRFRAAGIAARVRFRQAEGTQLLP